MPSSHLGSRGQHIHNVHTNRLMVVKRKYINFVQYIFIIVLFHYCQSLTSPYLQIKICQNYTCVVVESIVYIGSSISSFRQPRGTLKSILCA